MIKSITLIFTILTLSFVKAQEIGDTQTGKLNFYNDIYHGRPTASGDIYDKTKVSAAHKTLPMKTMVEVENLENGKSIFVEINDRIPEGSDAVLELSRAAAEQLDFIHDGVTQGKIRIIQVMNLGSIKPSSLKKSSKDVKMQALKQQKIEAVMKESASKKIEKQSELESKKKLAEDLKKKHLEEKLKVEAEAESKKVQIEETKSQISIEDAIKIGNKKYAIQLGAYKEKKSLNEALTIAQNKGMNLKVDLFILTETTESGELYKLIYGYFGEDFAREKITEIKTSFKDSFIKKF